MKTLKRAFYYLWSTDVCQRHCSVRHINTSHRDASDYSEIINTLQRAGFKSFWKHHSKYFIIDLTVIKETAIIEHSNQLSSSLNSLPNNEVPLITFDQFHFFRNDLQVISEQVNFLRQRHGQIVFFFIMTISVWQKEHFESSPIALASSVSVF